MGDDFDVWREGHLLTQRSGNEFDKATIPERMLTETHFHRLLAEWTKDRRRDTAYSLWGFDRETGKWVCDASFFDIIRGTQQNSWIGGHVLNPYWGSGYATESFEAMLELGFEVIGLHRIEALTETHNTGALSVLKKMNFRHEGVSKRRVLHRGKWRDAEVYAMTSEEHFRSL